MALSEFVLTVAFPFEIALKTAERVLTIIPATRIVRRSSSSILARKGGMLGVGGHEIRVAVAPLGPASSQVRVASSAWSRRENEENHLWFNQMFNVCAQAIIDRDGLPQAQSSSAPASGRSRAISSDQQQKRQFIEQLLADDLAKRLLADLGMENDSPAEQAEFLSILGENVMSRVALEILKVLPMT